MPCLEPYQPVRLSKIMQARVAADGGTLMRSSTDFLSHQSRSIMTVTFADVAAARERLDDDSIVTHTPLEISRSLSQIVDARVYLKMEHLQRTGSFKTRGAYNKLAQLAASGDVSEVVAASAGNHAQGVALCASELGLETTIVMPEFAPQTKVDATRGYGGNVILHGANFPEAMRYARSLEDGETAFIHAFDDPAIIAGQGSLGLEIADDMPTVDTVIVPIGGGGLISGVGVALAERLPDVRVVGVQAASAATVHESLAKGFPMALDSMRTFADGIATGGVSELTLDLIEAYVDEVITVSDAEIATSVLLLLERAKQLVEGAGAASVAAMMSEQLDVTGDTVIPVLSGGNFSIVELQTVLTHALSTRSQLVQLRIRIDDNPGQLHHLSGLIAETGANVRTVRHDRAVADLDVGEAYLTFTVETSGRSHTKSIIEAVRDDGYSITRLH